MTSSSGTHYLRGRPFGRGAVAAARRAGVADARAVSRRKERDDAGDGPPDADHGVVLAFLLAPTLASVAITMWLP